MKQTKSIEISGNNITLKDLRDLIETTQDAPEETSVTMRRTEGDRPYGGVFYTLGVSWDLHAGS